MSNRKKLSGTVPLSHRPETRLTETRMSALGQRSVVADDEVAGETTDLEQPDHCGARLADHEAT